MMSVVRQPLKAVGYGLITAILVLFSCPEAHTLSPQKVLSKVLDNVPALEILDEKGDLLYAYTAVLLNGKTAATQCSVVAGAKTLMLRQEKRAYPASVQYKDTARNLCLLSVSGAAPELGLRLDKPSVGARVYAISNALSLGISISEGVISGVREANGETAIQFTAPIAPGSEGGGLFDEDGKLIGIIDYQQRDGQNVNFAAPAAWLRQVKERSASANASEAWLPEGIRLARESKWRELADLAARWNSALPESREALYFLGLAYEQQKNWAAAEKAYRDLLKLEPDSSAAAISLAGTLLALKKPEEAREIVGRALRYRSEDSNLWVMIAYVEEAMGHSVEAEKAMNRAGELAPTNPHVLKAIVLMARRRNEPGTGIWAQKRLVDYFPQNLEERNALTDLLVSAGKTQKALNSSEKAIEMAPSSGDAWLYNGYALYALDRFREAEKAIRKGLDLKPATASPGLILLGDVYEALHMHPEAIDAYRKALLLEPANVRAKQQLGVTLKDHLQLKEALAIFEELRSQNPNDPLPWRQIGYVNSHLAEADKAIPAYEQSLKLDSKQPKVWAALIEAYHCAGRADEVRRSLDKLKSVSPEWADYAYKRVLLPYEVTP
jgi:tetratricopeptide (TPR) repeat protein